MCKSLLFGAMMFLPLFGYAQLDCVLPEPSNMYARGVNEWTAYVFQLSEDYKPNDDWNRNFTRGNHGRKFKGYLKKDNESFLFTNTVNFDTQFGDFVGGENDDAFFETTGCETQLKHFGIILRSRVTIPVGEPGIYRFTVGSDDGSRLNVDEKTIHDNWGQPKTYYYHDNLFNYYVPYSGGERVLLDLFYYENKGENRLSFHMERYFGPGEIEGSQDVCGIAPDPVTFGSRVGAVYKDVDTNSITYQWQYASINSEDPKFWTDIPGANGLVYDVPKYDAEDASKNWQGARYFRRVAKVAIEGEIQETPSNVVTVTLTAIDGLPQDESGNNSWIGHIYKGKDNYSDSTYMGRVLEESIFYSDFDYNNIPSIPNSFTPDHGCAFVTEKFSVRYKMKLDVSPGTYTFQVRGDDGFRLSVDGGVNWVINDWKNGSASAHYTMAEVEIDSIGQLDLVLDYYEDTQGNLLDFRFDFQSLILPLEWGQVSAEACGPANCLTWETMQEKNTSHFELERSYDGLDWEIFDNSIQAQGSSTEIQDYKSQDKGFRSSKVFYRIKQVDLDGTYAYSDVMRVDNPFYSKGFLPFPNPTWDKIRFFSKAEPVSVTVVSSDYRLYKQVGPNKLHDNRYELDLVGLKPGSYMIIIQQRGGEIETFRIIKK